MAHIYTIYNVGLAPQALLTRYPQAATYADGAVYLFGDTLESLTGTPAISIVDIAALGFNYPYIDDDNGLTESELNSMVDSLLADNHTGSEVQMSHKQGRYLYDTRFKPASTDEP
mgnify:CR=1 FL=1|jgi:hypothetical protein|tara:strand:+ start:617 stop:961 length:345 start_codon:yes stop_codon:yes gene_type:complete